MGMGFCTVFRRFCQGRRMNDLPPLLVGIFTALLLVPAFFWVGGKLLHVRIDGWPLAAAAIIIFFFLFLKK